MTDQQALLDLNTDFRMKGMASTEINALVAAWQAGAISQDSLLELFRRSGILPDGRYNEAEAGLIERGIELRTSNIEVRAARASTLNGEQKVVK